MAVQVFLTKKKLKGPTTRLHINSFEYLLHCIIRNSENLLYKLNIQFKFTKSVLIGMDDKMNFTHTCDKNVKATVEINFKK